MRRCARPSRRRLFVPRRCRHRQTRRSSSAIWKFNSSRLTDAMNHLKRTPGKAALRRAPLFVLGLCAAALAHAQLKIEITSGVTDPIPIAIVPFAHTTPGDGGLDVAAVVQHDWEGSGRFRAMPRARMTTNPARVENVQLADWRAGGKEHVAVGRVPRPPPCGQP